MKVAVICECGHVAEPDSREPVETPPEVVAAHVQRFCAKCGRSLAEAIPLVSTSSVEPATGPRTFQQLWQSRQSGSEEKSVEPTGPKIVRPTQTVDEQPSPATSGRRSLWDVMGGVSNTAPEHVSATDDSPPIKPKGLWNVMSASESATVADAPSTDDQFKTARSGEFNSASVTPAFDPMTRPSVPAVPVSAPAAAREITRHGEKLSQVFRAAEEVEDDVDAEWSWGALAALSLGIGTVILSGLSLQSGWLMRFPSLITGVAALMLGFIAIGDVRRSRGRFKGRFGAMTGVVLGALGMLLAPLLFARLGDSWRENAGREEIASRLRRIGDSLDQHHAQHGHFPPAVVFAKKLDAKQPLHGWMTPLLPFLGHEQIHRRLDLTQPFDAPANIAVMQQIIPEFVIPSRKLVRSPRGLGLTHFAGVGGEAVNEQVGLMHLGIFAEEGAVRREQITDGLSQTIVVGEIADPLPAWGEPGNMRTIGDGLNKQFHGFGNPSGTGATFLHGDGSVKFYSNKIDRRLLKQLETRDGGEAVAP